MRNNYPGIEDPFYDKEHATRFIKFLHRQEDSSQASGRANLAELRRSAADPLNDYRSIWILGSYLPDRNDWPFDAYRLVAVLFAIHKQRFTEKKLPQFNETEQKRRSLGASLRKLRGQLSIGQDSLDQRFSALLNAPREDVAIPLRGFIQRIASADKPVSVDYFRLITDLVYWNTDNNNTQRQWARDYWQPTAPLPDESDDKEELTVIPSA